MNLLSGLEKFGLKADDTMNLFEEEKKVVIEYKYQLSIECERECNLPILENAPFFMAEEEHQNYPIKNKEEFEKELIASGRKKV